MDIKCVICGEPWDSYGITHGDMEEWEAELFRAGAGCPCCKGVGNWEPKGIGDFSNGDEDEMERINAYENRENRPEWKKPEIAQPERGYVYESANADEIYYLDLADEDGQFVPYRAVHERGHHREVVRGDLHECIIPNLLAWSDHGNSTLIERSNYEAFLEMYGKDPSVRIIKDGYSGHMIGILSTCDNEDMARCLAGLHDYPLIDEEKHSEMEHEAIWDAWTSWASGDFQKEITENIENADELDFEDARLYELFEKARDISGAEWVNESGGEMDVDVVRVALEIEYEETTDGYVFFIPSRDDVQAYGVWTQENS